MNNSENNDKRHAKYRRKAILIFAIGAAVFLVFFILMAAILNTEAKHDQEMDNERFFSSTISNLNNNDRQINSLIESFDENNMIMLNNLVDAYSQNNYSDLKSMSTSDQSNMLLDATYTMENCLWLMIVNRDADVLVSHIEENNGQNVIKDGEIGITIDTFRDLCDGRIKKLEVDSPYDDIEDIGSKMYLYCKPIPGSYDKDGYKYILLAFSSYIIDSATDRMMDLSSWMSGSTIGTNGAVLMINAANDRILYGTVKGEDKTGSHASDIGIDIGLLKDRRNGIATIGGIRYFVSVRAYSSKLYGKDTYIIAAIPERDMYSINVTVVIWNACLVLIFSLLMIAYSSYTRSEVLKNKEDLRGIRLPGGLVFSRNLSGKILPVAITSALIIFFLAFYFKELMQLSNAFSDSVAVEEDITKNVEEINNLEKTFFDYHDEQYLSRAKLMSYIVELNGDKYLNSKNNRGLGLYDDVGENGSHDAVKDDYNNLITVINNSGELNELRTDNQVYNVYLISDKGVTLATSSTYWNYSLSRDKSDESYEFWDVLSGKKDSVVKDVKENEEGDLSQFIGCAMYYYTCLDEDGNTRYMSLTDYIAQENGKYKGSEITHHRGLMQVEIIPEDDKSLIDGAKPEYILENTKIANDGFLMGFDYDENEDDYRVFYSPVQSMLDKTATELGISKKAFNGNYNGFQTLDSEQYLQSFRPSDRYYIATAMPISSLNRNCVDTALFCALFSLIVMLIIYFYAVIIGDMDEEERYREETDPLAIFGHWAVIGDRKIESSTHVFETIIRNCLILLGSIFLITIFFEAYRFGKNSAILYILSGEWDRGVHIFSLSACFVIIILSYILIRLFGRVACLIASAFGNRGVTIMRLVTGLIKVAAVAVVALYCLYLMGINGTRLLASAGIMSVVVGLGAQSLVGDLLAGIFIIMEGSLHVGDYVLIDGIRGRVTEIGLRTTRYEDDNQNIRIICNNEMKTFANMSMKYSVIYYHIPVPYDMDYLKIRKILNEEFILLYENHRFLKGIPSCLGIEEFSESSVDMCVRFVCEEAERLGVQRFMHDEIMRIFTDNDIHIPFNQLDIHVDRLFAKE
ncbi:MAG: mechanosensitive ion channel family protein [Lachnospiraceae bacterium]|nr:mechanosensitive ion channel family protein [Lachnospiraceae bacterium]